MSSAHGPSRHSSHFLHDRVFYLTLSIEALWLARTIQDALDVILESEAQAGSNAEDARLKALRLNRDVFERLGLHGCSPEPVSPLSHDWTAASRVELIRQLAVHWRAFIDTSFGSAIGARLIKALSDDEIRLLEQIQRFSHTLQLHHAAVTHCMQQQLHLLAEQQESRRARRCESYLGTPGDPR